MTITAERLAEWKSAPAHAADSGAVPALVQEVERLRALLKRALPSVESDSAMMDAMDRHSPLPAADMPSVTAAANSLNALLVDIHSALPEESAGD